MRYPLPLPKFPSDTARVMAGILGLLVVALSAAVLLGWALDLAWMVSVLPGQAAMKANAALALLVLGLAIQLLVREPPPTWCRRVALACASGVALLAAASLAADLAGLDWGIDQLLFDDPYSAAGAAPGRISPGAAVGLALLAFALLYIDAHTGWAQLAALFAFLIGLFALVGYAYGAPTLYRLSPFTPVAPHTAFALSALALAALLLRPRRGWFAVFGIGGPAGLLGRWLLPAALMLPFSMGWLGLQGQQAGLYGTEIGLALFALSNIVVFGGLAWVMGRALNGLDDRRRATLAALAESEARKDAMLAASLDAIVTMDASGRVLEWNPAAERMFGHPRADAVGHEMAMLIIPERLRAAHRTGLARYLAGGEGPMLGRLLELPARRRDGSEFPAEVAITRIPLSGTAIFTGFIRDITERKRGEAAQREGHERLAGLIDSAMDAIVSVDATQHIVLFNPAAERMFGLPAAEALGRPLERLIPERFRAAHAEHIRRFGRAGVTTRQMGALGAVMGLRANGEEFPVEASISRIKTGGQQLFTVILRDITERMRVEAELNRLNAELETRVQQRTAELEEANRELESFSYSISHDLRAPLRAMDGFSRILVEEYADRLDAEALGHLERVRRNAQRMGQLVDELLEFSRLGRKPLHRQRVELGALLADCLEALAEERSGRRTEVVVGDLPACQGDPTLLRQVLFNLLSNALKFTRGRATARIEVGAVARAGELELFVADNGVGFDMQYADKLFGVFQRLHNEAQYEGTGVGLAMVKRIVERHGGRVWAESAPDHGATFHLTLPASAED